MLESVDSEYPLPPDASSDDIGLFLNRLSMHLVNALKDKDFRGKMLQMAGVENPVPAHYVDEGDEDDER